jgi:signal transduction histidine kinase
MRKLALVFVLAVFVPSLALAWLAIRSLQDQQYVLERQQSLLCQSVSDTLAREIAESVSELQRDFAQQVETLLVKDPPRELAAAFDDRLRPAWPLADVGFVVSLEGQMYSPSLFDRSEGRRFRLENDLFLCNRETAEAYWNAAKNAPAVPQIEDKSGISTQSAVNTYFSFNNLRQSKDQKLVRNVAPQQAQSPDISGNYSKVAPAEGEFRQLVGDSTGGTVARFLQNKLNLMFWHRPARDPDLVFGALINLPKLTERFRQTMRIDPELLRAETGVALLDDSARPVATEPATLSANWKRPLVATEIGEALPHWEVAVYLVDPARLTRSAQAVRLTLGLLIFVLVLAILTGGWLIVADLRRQTLLTRQKTDFVSNVSHELKTPLTSIRMFSELLAAERVPDRKTQRDYLNIITSEAARLTRLINNVLDFSRMERGEKKFVFASCDLCSVMRETIESYRPHLEQMEFTLDCVIPDEPLRVKGDRDALAQVMVNLLSNAEKYSGGKKEIRVEIRPRTDPIPYVEVRVSDRGVGVPPGCEEKIFEQFYRAHDSLSSGIQGSGLGLTLARSIARAHGGELVCQPREGGGTCFVLRLPTDRIS